MFGAVQFDDLQGSEDVDTRPAFHMFLKILHRDESVTLPCSVGKKMVLSLFPRIAMLIKSALFDY